MRRLCSSRKLLPQSFVDSGSLYGCPGPPFESLRVLFPSCGPYCVFSVKIALLQGLCVYDCVKSLWGALVRRFEVCRMRITITNEYTGIKGFLFLPSGVVAISEEGREKT